MFEEFWTRIFHIWTLGGWTMLPLALLSFLIYVQGIHLLLYFSRRAYRHLPREVWSRWLQEPAAAPDEVVEMLQYTQDRATSLNEVHNRFAEVAAARLPYVDRRLVFLNLLITAAPLVGLLGTVTGMLMTFQALGAGGGEITEMMSSGISQALFPPEVGLCVALPGMALVYVIKRKRNEYEAFLARLESAVVQKTRRRLAPAGVAQERSLLEVQTAVSLSMAPAETLPEPA